MSHPQAKTEPTSIPEAAALSATVPQVDAPPAQFGDGPRFAPPSANGELGRLGKYRIQKELGRGGMGAVYLALDERLQRRVALKVMLPAAAADTLAKERFLREARAAAQVSSDHVVSIHEAEEINGIPYISLQFLQGYPLDDYIRKNGSPSIPQIIRIGQETALGLEAAHRLGLIHRDIKPANLWLEAPNGRVKILDFGLARQRDEHAVLTQKGLVVGTPAYMSPEQARGQALDARSDLFSLGSVLYHLCTGQLPFPGDGVMAILTALSVDDPSPVRSHNPQVPEALANLIHRLLLKQPANRPATAQLVADELKTLFDLSQSPAVVSGQPQVIFMPMAITVHEPNPFEEITQIGTVSGALATEVEQQQTSKKPFPIARVAIAGAAVVALALGAFFIFNPGTRENPDSAKNPQDVTPPPKVNPPKVVPPVIPKDPERAAAEYVLSIGGVVKINDEEGELTKVGDLPKAPEMFRLTLANLPGNAKLTDAGLANFKGCKHLVYLNLDRTPLTDAGAANLSECKNVRYLNLSQTQITDAALVHFKDCKRLARLDLGNVPITDAGLVNFADCTELREVYVPHTKVGVGAAACFKNATQLAAMRLDDTKFGDEGIKDLLGKTALTALDIQQTQVTAVGLDMLKAALPQCRIIHDGGVIEPTKK